MASIKIKDPKKRELPWSRETYKALDRGDLDPVPAPTDAQRLRVAATVATLIRDAVMTGREPPTNAEAVRGILTMSPEAWKRDIWSLAQLPTADLRYDTEDPYLRFQQTQNAWGRS